METEDKLIALGVSIVLVAIFIIIVNPFTIVNAGERGVVMNWGAVSEKVLDEGLHVLVPIQQVVKKMNTKTVKYETTVSAYSQDSQTVNSKVALNYHLEGDKVNKIYQEVGDNKTVEGTIVDPSIQETVKLVIAEFTARDLLDKRASVSEGMRSDLEKKLAKAHIKVDALSVIDFNFSEDYETAVEEKQIAQQRALKAENDLNRIKAEAEQTIAQAQAAAEAISIQSEAITEQGGEAYLKLKAIEKWDGSLPYQMVPNAALPFIDVSK